jgi:cell wall-associated NlpC family hydrolase
MVLIGQEADLKKHFGNLIVIAVSCALSVTAVAPQLNAATSGKHRVAQGQWQGSRQGQAQEPRQMLPQSISSQAATELAQKAYECGDWVFNHATKVHYEHKQKKAAAQVRVDGDRCLSNNDCSGFISYVLRTVAPEHYAPIREMQDQRAYPQAKTYAHFFGRLSPDRPFKGWIGLRSYRDLRRGDIIAWEKGGSNADHGGHGNSGHVMMVIDPPSEITEGEFGGRLVHYVSVFVLDSSSVVHFPPEKLPPNAYLNHRDGLGKGYIRLVIAEDSRVIGYWEGSYWGEGHKDITKPSYSDEVHFGRLTSFAVAEPKS